MFVLLSQEVAAETVYVTDVLYVTVRESKAPNSNVIKVVKTGTPLEVVEAGEPYVKVRLESGEEGYVKEQYLDKELPKPIIISRLRQEVDRLKIRLAESGDKHKEQLAELKETEKIQSDQEQELKRQLLDVEESLSKTQDELQMVTEKYNLLVEKSKNVIEISDERDKLQEEHKQLSSEVETLKLENSKLLRMGAIKWFLAGAVVLWLGWIAGRASKRTRSRL